MAWEDFREEYTRLKVELFRSDEAKDAAEVRLDVCQAIIKPRTLQQMADPKTLANLQRELRAGTASRKGPRSANTVRSYMMALKAALNWAHEPMGWLPNRFTFQLLEADESETL
jgi:hypothetical protein